MVPVLRELLARTGLAVIGIPIILICAYQGGWWLLIATALITVMALSEYYSATFTRGLRPRVGIGFLGAVSLLAVATFAPAEHQPSLMILVLFGAIALSMLTQGGASSYEGATVSSAVTIFGVVYIGLLMTFFIRLCHINLPEAMGMPAGLWAQRTGALLLVILPVWLLDSFAFAIGSAWGRRPLTPILSPRKTIEGAVAGFLGCVGTTLLVGWWLQLPWQHSLALGILLGIFAQLGDLAKSTIKRDLNLDDFGNIFGPHGGVLDRFDGLLFAMPVAYFYLWLAFLT